MRRIIIELAIGTLMIFVCGQVIGAQENSNSDQLENLDRAIVFAVQMEIHANRLENRTDVCVGFGNGLVVDEKAILFELKQEKLKVRSDDWCNRGPRGLSISVISSARESEPGTYEIRIELGDNWPISQHGAHFGTLLHSGTYSVKCGNGAEPELVRYQETALPSSISYPHVPQE